MSDPPVTVLKPAKPGKVFKESAESPLEVLERARLVLSPRGAWMRGGFKGTSKTGVAQRCAVQAIEDCDGQHAKAAKAILLKAINEKVSYASIPSWNDAGARTKYQVLSTFDRAIEIAKET